MEGLTDASSAEPTWPFLKILFPGYLIMFIIITVFQLFAMRSSSSWNMRSNNFC